MTILPLHTVTHSPAWRSRFVCAWPLLGVLLGLSACGGGTEVPLPERLPSATELQVTGRELDLGIDGPGAFVLVHPLTGEQRYSRWGRFDLSAEGRLISVDGWYLAGMPPASAVAADGRPTVGAAALPAQPIEMAASASTVASVEFNLSSAHASLAGVPFNPSDGSTHHIMSSFPIILMNAWVSGWLTCFLRRVDDLADGSRSEPLMRWEMRVYLNGKALPGDPVWLLGFPQGGGRAVQGVITLQLPLEQAAGQPAPGTQTLVLDLSNTTASDGAFGLKSLSHDGYPRGTLSNLRIDEQGQIQLGYSNGQDRDGGRVLLARFTEADQLERQGLLWACNTACAAPTTGLPGDSVFGRLRAGALNLRY